MDIFEKIKGDHISLKSFNNHDKGFIMALLKIAYNDGVEAGKQEIKDELTNVCAAINSFLENR